VKITTSKISGFALLMLTGATAQAADIYCGGTISMLMADHPGCNGQMAFKTNTTSGSWMCSKSKEANALLMAAQFAGKDIAVYIEGGDVSGCSNLPHYRAVSYIITYSP